MKKITMFDVSSRVYEFKDRYPSIEDAITEEMGLQSGDCQLLRSFDTESDAVAFAKTLQPKTTILWDGNVEATIFIVEESLYIEDADGNLELDCIIQHVAEFMAPIPVVEAAND